jgi:hypothetical protein
VPVLGGTIGGLVGSVGGKLVGGVAGIALSKILEVYETIKTSKIKKMSTIPQLMANLSPESELMRSLMVLTLERNEDERVVNLVDEALNRPLTVNSLYPSLNEFFDDQVDMNSDKYDQVQQLATDAMSDGEHVEYFILTPLPDGNAHEQFSSATDILLIRWPTEMIKPWDTEGEKVLDITDMDSRQS